MDQTMSASTSNIKTFQRYCTPMKSKNKTADQQIVKNKGKVAE